MLTTVDPRAGAPAPRLERPVLIGAGAAFAVVERHFPTRERVVHDARATVDDEVEVATIALTVENLLARCEVSPTAAQSAAPDCGNRTKRCQPDTVFSNADRL